MIICTTDHLSFSKGGVEQPTLELGFYPALLQHNLPPPTTTDRMVTRDLRLLPPYRDLHPHSASVPSLQQGL